MIIDAQMNGLELRFDLSLGFQVGTWKSEFLVSFPNILLQISLVRMTLYKTKCCEAGSII